AFVWSMPARLVGRQRGVGVLVPAEAPGWSGLEQVRVYLRRRVALPQWLYIVEDPESAAVRGHHDVVVLDDQIANRAGRHVQAQRLPMIAVVKGDVHLLLAAGEQQPSALRIFADHVDRPAVGN